MERELLLCVISLGEQLIAGEQYPFLGYDARRDRVRVIDQRGRPRWYPADHFSRVPATSPGLVSFTLDDPIHDPEHDCIEVTVELNSGQLRWCFFVTARWLLDALAGELKPKTVAPQGVPLTQYTCLDTPLVAASGQPFRMIGVPHMIVVSTLSREVVAETLGHLAGQGGLRSCTKLLRRRPRHTRTRDNAPATPQRGAGTERE
jgi:hypothetical protein